MALVLTEVKFGRILIKKTEQVSLTLLFDDDMGYERLGFMQ